MVIKYDLHKTKKRAVTAKLKRETKIYIEHLALISYKIEKSGLKEESAKLQGLVNRLRDWRNS